MMLELGGEKPGKGFIWLLAVVNTAPLDRSQNIMSAGCDEVKSKKFLNARDLLMVVQERRRLTKCVVARCAPSSFRMYEERVLASNPGLPLRTSKTLNDDFSPVLNKYSLKFS